MDRESYSQRRGIVLEASGVKLNNSGMCKHAGGEAERTKEGGGEEPEDVGRPRPNIDANYPGYDGHDLEHHLDSPQRRVPTQQFDWRELAADDNFHVVLTRHKIAGFFDSVIEGTPQYSKLLSEVCTGYARANNDRRAAIFRNRGIQSAKACAFREAISCYNRALELSVYGATRHITLANRAAAYIKCFKFAEALADTEEAALVCPGYSKAYTLMGYCMSHFGRTRDAIKAYNCALKLNPKDRSTRSLLKEAEDSLPTLGGLVATDSEDTSSTDPVGLTKKEETPIDDGRKLTPDDLIASVWTASVSPDDSSEDPANEVSVKAARTKRAMPSGAHAFSSLVQLPTKLKYAIVGSKVRQGRRKSMEPRPSRGIQEISGRRLASSSSPKRCTAAEDRSPPRIQRLEKSSENVAKESRKHSEKKTRATSEVFRNIAPETSTFGVVNVSVPRNIPGKSSSSASNKNTPINSATPPGLRLDSVINQIEAEQSKEGKLEENELSRSALATANNDSSLIPRPPPPPPPVQPPSRTDTHKTRALTTHPTSGSESTGYHLGVGKLEGEKPSRGRFLASAIATADNGRSFSTPTLAKPSVQLPAPSGLHQIKCERHAHLSGTIGELIESQDFVPLDWQLGWETGSGGGRRSGRSQGAVRQGCEDGVAEAEGFTGNSGSAIPLEQHRNRGVIGAAATDGSGGDERGVESEIREGIVASKTDADSLAAPAGYDGTNIRSGGDASALPLPSPPPPVHHSGVPISDESVGTFGATAGGSVDYAQNLPAYDLYPAREDTAQHDLHPTAENTLQFAVDPAGEDEGGRGDAREQEAEGKGGSRGNSGDGVASPETVAYNDEKLPLPERPTTPPIYIFLRGESPGAPMQAGRARYIERKIAEGYYRHPDDTPERALYTGPGRGTGKKSGQGAKMQPLQQGKCLDAVNGRWESTRLTPRELEEAERRDETQEFESRDPFQSPTTSGRYITFEHGTGSVGARRRMMFGFTTPTPSSDNTPDVSMGKDNLGSTVPPCKVGRIVNDRNKNLIARAREQPNASDAASTPVAGKGNARGSNNSAGGLAPGSGVVDGDPESHVEGQPDDNKNSSKNNSNRKIIPDEARRDRISTAIHRHRSGGVKPDQSGEQSAEKNTGGNSSNELASERRKPGLAVDDPRTDAGYQEDVLNRVTAWVLAVTSPQLAPSIHGDDESIKIDGDGKSTKIDGGKPAKVDLLALLRDGTVLVALVTAIEPETVAAIRRGNDGAEQQPKAEGVTGNNFALSTSALSRGKDLAIFFDACIKLGVPREHHFREQDLLQVAGLERVVHCLAMLWNVTRSTTPERSGPVWRRKTNGVGSISSMHGGLNNARNGDDKYFLS